MGQTRWADTSPVQKNTALARHEHGIYSASAGTGTV